MSTQLDPLSLSADLLYTVKTEGDAEPLRDHLATIDRSRLERALSSREGKLAFWLNCYNAYAQLLLESEEPDLHEGGLLEAWKFFARDRVPVGGVWLSLNDIEHGLLRSSKLPWGMGYLPRPFPSSFERQFRLDDCDPRIHFAISHATDHCPPIAVYSPQDVDEELDIAIEWFLEENVSYDRETETATVPQLFRRYRGDFGGRRGIVAFLREYNAVPADAGPSLEYERVDHSAELDVDLEGDEVRR
ncbi:hypothetical protein C488_16864 [Natrinema pellirubrum DSM 15624]|uniref:DUF547 domain-containing protein n=1 Tax=Natrinema pellirubrum (strain DSM 15624 / CIP 106293 / JCM 10476 / NCIMB 786 / 157) TaxID=797303 RepID=L0JR13_NATP1|nr:DUF547 domain-containing protein [Natrinema pellirubrum]AGB33258.1 Protein of unknown function, DUF547 [Natrinema pellirubrum DSM 15624]ELY71622.1 hypothetical protein C488_16864 [Natrinema pellirubrum DSM 15624]